LRVPDREAEQYMTLQGCVDHLLDDLKARATIEVLREGGGGPVYTADEIGAAMKNNPPDEPAA
jgi:hypothetical protein